MKAYRRDEPRSRWDEQGAPPPHNLDAERGLIGALLMDNDLLFDLSSHLGKADFWEPFHGDLYVLIREQVESGRAVTPITAMHDMAQDRDLGGIKVSEYLGELAGEAVPRTVAIELARAVRDLSLRRRILAAVERVAEETRAAPVGEAAEAIRGRLDGILESLFTGIEDLGVRHIGDVGQAVLKRVNEAFQAETVVGLNVGLKQVQDLIGPLMPGRLYLFGGAPGSGKSALAAQIAEYVAQTNPVLIDEIEMPAEELAERTLASRSDISADSIERAALDETDMERLIAANGKMAKLHLWIDSSASPTVAQIRGRAMRMKRLKGLALLVIDHLLYIQAPPGMKDHEGVRHNLQGLKRLAKDLGLPVICLTQPTQDLSKGPIRRPKVADLYGGSANEQEADVILLIHREEYQLRRNEPAETSTEWAEWKTAVENATGKAEVILGKRRGGKGYGLRTLYFDADRTRFSDNMPRQAVARSSQANWFEDIPD